MTPSSSRRALRVPRDLPIPGRDALGVHFAMEYLAQSNRVQARRPPSPSRSRPRASTSSSSAAATRARTASVPLTARAPLSGHEPRDRHPAAAPSAPRTSRGRCSRRCSRCRARTRRAASACTSPRPSSSSPTTPGEVRALASPRPSTSTAAASPRPGTEHEIPADLVLLALGFTGAERSTLDDAARPPDRRARHGRRATADYATKSPACSSRGMPGRGAVADRLGDRGGARRAAEVDRFLQGDDRPSGARQGHRPTRWQSETTARLARRAAPPLPPPPRIRNS